MSIAPQGFRGLYQRRRVSSTDAGKLWTVEATVLAIRAQPLCSERIEV
jgi:hypothetical protein